MKRKRTHPRRPITFTVGSSAPTTNNSPSSPTKKRKLSTTQRINEFHALTKRLAHIQKQIQSTNQSQGQLNNHDDNNEETSISHGTTNGTLEDEAARVKEAIEALGGLHAYQRASLKGGDESKGRGACGKWLVGMLNKYVVPSRDGMGSRKSEEKEESAKKVDRLKLLDIGALNGATYAKQRAWIDAEYVDLNPQHANVIRQDFFERPLPRNKADLFDVLCLSLVVNFVDDPERRGIMLMRARQFLVPSGLLFIVLPLPCTKNSRYMTHERIVEICKAIGFEEIEFHFTKRLSYHLWRRVEGHNTKKAVSVEKKMVNPGAARNNFSIIVK
ncbi:hypothetical protein CcCBS67573_g00752 [Chytriomyces confervae]|uniref:25S rRNA adenine-N(1) methyltransferase n=1 Tax=Chytriomyces confervae TaxID=246404 RepID=A0A507FRF0_9FUNG|nr:hypothetical protein CcCBS67573_g00752 [Chytriomyces confervae]